MQRTRLITRGLFALSLITLSAAPVAAGPYDQIVAFGDSLSDTGNDLILFGSPTAPYYNGRFSNGPNWIDQLSVKLGVPDPQPSLAGGTNYAYGGATAASAFSPSNIPYLAQQVQSYLQTSPKADPNTLYTILDGANDFFNGQTNPSIPASAVNAAMTSLIAAGAKNILVSYLPPQGITPDIQSQGPAAVAAINALDVAFNADIAADVKALQAANPSVRIDTMDLYTQGMEAVQDPSMFGFTNVTDEGILAPPGTDISHYLFWDDVHPTTYGHSFIADAALQALVPEPGGLTLASVCGLGLAVRAWRRKRAG
jgi:phospholipase/lecithinase/hemolysin